jgi:hypothetical protein
MASYFLANTSRAISRSPWSPPFFAEPVELCAPFGFVFSVAHSRQIAFSRSASKMLPNEVFLEADQAKIVRLALRKAVPARLL